MINIEKIHNYLSEQNLIFENILKYKEKYLSITTNLLYSNNDSIEIQLEFDPDKKRLIIYNTDIFDEIYNDKLLNDIKNNKIKTYNDFCIDNKNLIMYKDLSFLLNENKIDKEILEKLSFYILNFAKNVYAIQFLSFYY